MSTEKSVSGLVTPEENLITQLAGYVRGGRSIQMTTLVGVLQLLERQTAEIIILNQQLSAKTISEQNIINAFVISGEGAHSKLVIEYVSGLVAENAALKDINAWCRTDAFQNMYREFKIAEAAGCDTTDCMHDAMLTAIMHAPATPSTDAAIAEIGAKPLDILAGVAETMLVKFSNAGVSHCPEAVGWRLVKRQAESEAANLRAGRKG